MRDKINTPLAISNIQDGTVMKVISQGAFILQGSEEQLYVNATEMINFDFFMMKKNNFVLLEFDFDPLCVAVLRTPA